MQPKVKYEAIYPPELGKGITISNSRMTDAERARREKAKADYGRAKQKKRRPKLSKQKKGTFEEFMRISTAGSHIYPGFAHDIRFNLVKYNSIHEREETLRRYIDNSDTKK